MTANIPSSVLRTHLSQWSIGKPNSRYTTEGTYNSLAAKRRTSRFGSTFL